MTLTCRCLIFGLSTREVASKRNLSMTTFTFGFRFLVESEGSWWTFEGFLGSVVQSNCWLWLILASSYRGRYIILYATEALFHAGNATFVDLPFGLRVNMWSKMIRAHHKCGSHSFQCEGRIRAIVFIGGLHCSQHHDLGVTPHDCTSQHRPRSDLN